MSFSSSFSVPTVRAIAQLLDEAQLSEITIETTDAGADANAPTRLVVRREFTIANSGTHAASADAETNSNGSQSVEENQNPVAESNLVMVPSPTVGFFHHVEKPVGIGASVKAGQVLSLVKTLAIPNDVTASVDGRVVEILVAEGQGVAFGQPLFVIEKELQEEL